MFQDLDAYKLHIDNTIKTSDNIRLCEILRIRNLAVKDYPINRITNMESTLTTEGLQKMEYFGCERPMRSNIDLVGQYRKGNTAS